MKILFLAPKLGGVSPGRQLATFHEADVQILHSLGHEVDVLPWHGRPVLSLMRRAARADLLYVWTVGDHTALACAVGRMARKPVVVVIGGYEFANLPDIGYGNLAHPRGQLLSGLVYSQADLLLYVDESLMLEAHQAFGGRVPWESESSGEIHANGVCVPTGYDADYWKPDGPKEEDMILTVAHCPGANHLSLKGVDRFLALARAFPDLEFHIAGELPPVLRDGSTPSNVILHGWLERFRIKRLMQRAKVFCLLSRHEGLPNAMAEAMLCGCRPLGSQANGIPALMGRSGVISCSPLADGPGLKALLGDDDWAEDPRERISRLFPLERRRESLRRVLEELS